MTKALAIIGIMALEVLFGVLYAVYKAKKEMKKDK